MKETNGTAVGCYKMTIDNNRVKYTVFKASFLFAIIFSISVELTTVDVGLREGLMEDWGTVKCDVLLLNVVKVLALVDE